MRSQTLGLLARGLLLCGLALASLALPATTAAAASRPLARAARGPRPSIARAARAPRPSIARAARGPTVYGALQNLKSSGGLTAEAYGEDASTYTGALVAVKHLTGTRRAELESVVANVQQIAASGQLIPSRLPALMLTLESNVEWWSHQPLLSADQRVSLPPSHLVWEHYPGQGIEIQWLATFGEANGYYDNGHDNAQLRELLAEAIPLATQRAGGIAWEYFFHFDGGAPPWTSGLSQGTALQVLARAYSRLKEPAYLTAAKQALGIFETPPPAGVRVAQPAGTLYAEYTYAPTDRILNGFIQALNGLYEYAKLTGDPLGRQLFEAGDTEARAITPLYDTGAWSKYDQYAESDLNYHELLTEFLQSLCERTHAIPGDQVYCTTAQRFAADLHTPPAIALLTRKLPEGVRGGVQLSLSKISNVSLTIRRGGHVVWTNSALLEGGKPRLLWVTPRKPGAYSVSVTAVDLAGNTSSTSATIALGASTPAKAPAHSKPPHAPKLLPARNTADRRGIALGRR
jgi:hypothetical protein